MTHDNDNYWLARAFEIREGHAELDRAEGVTDDTIHFHHDFASGVTSPVLTAEEARLLLDHLDNVRAATLLGDKWLCWCAAKKKLVFFEVDGTKT